MTALTPSEIVAILKAGIAKHSGSSYVTIWSGHIAALIADWEKRGEAPKEIRDEYCDTEHQGALRRIRLLWRTADTALTPSPEGAQDRDQSSREPPSAVVVGTSLPGTEGETDPAPFTRDERLFREALERCGYRLTAPAEQLAEAINNMQADMLRLHREKCEALDPYLIKLARAESELERLRGFVEKLSHMNPLGLVSARELDRLIAEARALRDARKEGDG
jgi:hypothetical protein